MKRYVAICKLCKWQYAITEEQRPTAERGCPACGAGKDAIRVEPESEGSTHVERS